MKKLLLTLAFLFVAAASFAYTAYCSVSYNAYTRVALINCGGNIFSINRENGTEPMQFVNLMEVFGYLGKKGWTLVPLPYTEGGVPAYVFSKEVSSDAQVKKDFNVR